MIKPRVAQFLTGFLVWVLFPAFLAAADLPAYKKYEGPIKPGVVITKENWDKYLPELQRLLTPSGVQWYGMGVKEGLVTMPIVEVTPNWIAKGQMEATMKYKGTARVGADNRLLNWVAGYPFPEPRNAQEILWNCYPSNSRNNAQDDFLFYAWFGLFQGTKYEKHFTWNLFSRKYRGRTDIAPLGDTPEFTDNGVFFKEAMLITEPDEVKGFINLKIRYWDIEKADENYAYIPAIRRVRRMIGADLTDPVLGSDYIPDDSNVMKQKIDSRMKFRVLERRDFLVPRTYVGLEDKPVYDYKKNGPCFPVEWTIRPLWVLEVMINNPDYVYSKRMLYVDALPIGQGGNFFIYWGDNYDQKGQLWKSCYLFPAGTDKGGAAGFGSFVFSAYMNNKTRHYTAMDVVTAYMKDYEKKFPLDVEKSFTIKGLLRNVR